VVTAEGLELDSPLLELLGEELLEEEDSPADEDVEAPEELDLEELVVEELDEGVELVDPEALEAGVALLVVEADPERPAEAAALRLAAAVSAGSWPDASCT
jgi:hypothetical protein